MIQNYAKFSRWNEKSDKIYTLWKFYIYLTMINTTCDLLGQLYIFLITSCKIFHLKKNHMKKWKRSKKDSQSFCKLILLAPITYLHPFVVQNLKLLKFWYGYLQGMVYTKSNHKVVIFNINNILMHNSGYNYDIPYYL
jgi:hypothetical protein